MFFVFFKYFFFNPINWITTDMFFHSSIPIVSSFYSLYNLFPISYIICFIFDFSLIDFTFKDFYLNYICYTCTITHGMFYPPFSSFLDHRPYWPLFRLSYHILCHLTNKFCLIDFQQSSPTPSPNTTRTVILNKWFEIYEQRNPLFIWRLNRYQVSIADNKILYISENICLQDLSVL